jgi:hypothetical protein
MPRDREGSAPRGPEAHDYWLAPLRRQFDQRQMERQEEAATAGSTTADLPQTDAYGIGWGGLYGLRFNLQQSRPGNCFSILR